MKTKPKLEIIVLFQNLEGQAPSYYARSPAPPLPGLLIAGMTPDIVEVSVRHEMVRPIDYDADIDFVALSFMDYCFPHAIEVAKRFRARGIPVVAGGKYPSTFPSDVMPHFDATVVGEAEHVWHEVVEDLVAGTLKKAYVAPFAPPIDDIPPPRYDLAEKDFLVPIVTEATRGCNFRCRFCQLQVVPAPYRKRPIPDVIADLKNRAGVTWYKRRFAMLHDNNLGGDMAYAKDLLREIAKLKLWGLGVQFSFNCLQDPEFMDLLAEANCGMAFIGLESLNEPSLRSVHKRQNRVAEYRDLFQQLRERGILTFTGMIVGLDEDTPEYFATLPERIEEVDPSAILTSIAIPIVGTPLHADVQAEGRIFDFDLSHYEGDHVVFHALHVTPDQVIDAFDRLNREFYAWPAVVRRWWRFISAMKARKGGIRWLLDAIVRSVVLLRLSVFQRHHARLRVPVAREAWRKMKASGAPDEAHAPWRDEQKAAS